MLSMQGFELEVDFVTDLRVTVSGESDVKEEVVDARLAAGSIVGSVSGSAPGLLLLELLR